MENLFSALPVLSRILIGLYFAFFGFWNIYHWRPLMKDMLEKNIPSPFFILTIGIGLQSIAGIMIMFGIYVKIVAICLIPMIMITAYIFHPFWRYTGELRRLNFSYFVGYYTIILGALILLLTHITPINSYADLLLS